MNIDSTESVNFDNGLLKQPFSKFTIRLIGHCDKLFIGLLLRVEHIYKKLIDREIHQCHRPAPVIDPKFHNMLSGVLISATPSFELNSYFGFTPKMFFKKSQMNAEEILTHLRANNFGFKFFTPEEVHQVVAKITQKDFFCKRNQPVIIFYRYPESLRIFCIWMFRDKRNRLHVYDLDYYVSGFKLPTFSIVFTKDNVLEQEETIPD